MLIPLREATPEDCGGKAVGLRQLLEAGLPVPEGYCLSASVYRAALPETLPDPATPLREVVQVCCGVRAALERWEPGAGVLAALAGARAELGAPVAVRSSASCEDRAGQSAAGLFASTLGLDELPALIAAVRTSWVSLWTPLAWAALRCSGRSPSDEAMAIIVQRQVPAIHSGFAASHDPQRADHLRVETIEGAPGPLAQGTAIPRVALLPRAGLVGAGARVKDATLGPRTREALRSAVLGAEETLGGAVEVEWIDDGERLWLVQARQAPPRPASGRDEAQWAAGEDEGGAAWRWDREHNPEPLSAAHASLMAWLDRALGGSRRFSVRQGYLFTALTARAVARDPALGTTVEAGEFAAALASLAPSRAAKASPGPDATAPAPAAAWTALQRALADFADFYLRYEGTPVALRRRAHGALEQALAAAGVAAPAERAAALSLGEAHQAWQHSAALWQLGRAAREDATLKAWLADGQAGPLPQAIATYLEAHGALAARWDVAEPTFAEDPERWRGWLRARLSGAEEDDPLTRIAAQRASADAELDTLLRGLSASAREALGRYVAAARQARASAEDDDWCFARALAAARRLAAGRRRAGGQRCARRPHAGLRALTRAPGFSARRPERRGDGGGEPAGRGRRGKRVAPGARPTAPPARDQRRSLPLGRSPRL
ncbi:MAG: hypothetical protein IPL40_06810 [Proteobacteria bacterium]|nr:hypothetical protein [Pseudomonadota bacterium]